MCILSKWQRSKFDKTKTSMNTIFVFYTIYRANIGGEDFMNAFIEIIRFCYKLWMMEGDAGFLLVHDFIP